MARQATKKPTAKPAKAGSTVSFEYIKGQYFRVVHADGAVGALTPSGNLHIAFYSERPAIPNVIVHRRNKDGSLGSIIPARTVGKTSMIRELDIDVIIDPSAIEDLILWLEQQKDKNKDRKAGRG